MDDSGEWGGMLALGCEKDHTDWIIGVGGSLRGGDVLPPGVLWPPPPVCLPTLVMFVGVAGWMVERKSNACNMTTYGVSGAAGFVIVWLVMSAWRRGDEIGERCAEYDAGIEIP